MEILFVSTRPKYNDISVKKGLPNAEIGHRLMIIIDNNTFMSERAARARDFFFVIKIKRKNGAIHEKYGHSIRHFMQKKILDNKWLPGCRR